MKINVESKQQSLLRFTTAGSVDDGKSTLIGRLLYDSKSIFEDQLEHVTLSSKRLGKEDIDLSLLTDGLRAEREQGITIDVAYRYFATPVRKFIIADTPGHIQYTRNMVTGASTADLAVILIDTRKGVLEQTIRHTFIASLLDIRHIVFCVNKMDMVDYSEDIFIQIRNELVKLTERLRVEDVRYIPISAKYGDNVVKRSQKMEWYNDMTFLNLIEAIEIKKDKNSHEARLPVQTVIRPLSEQYHDYRGYAGRVAGGKFNSGDDVVILPSLMKTKIKSIDIFGKSITAASTGDSVSVSLEDQVDISRGDMIVKPGELPRSGHKVNLMVCWFNEKPVQHGNRYIIRNNTNETNCRVESINYKVNINTLDKETNISQAGMNEIVNMSIKSSKLLFYDDYKRNNITGSVIFIDEGTFETVGAGMIV
jgi:sulfate adenylyltransferase subunit 1